MGINKVQYGNTVLIDLTDATATADKILQGYTAYGRDGSKLTGTATGGGSGDGYVWQDQDGYVHLSDEEGTQISVEALSVTQNGTYTAPTGKAYSPVTVNVSGGGGVEPAPKKQINFIDYDGTIVESYTKSEWQNVTALPSNPSHTGLTAQGWNWTKAQIDAQLTAVPDGDVWVGQMYITTSGDTEIDVVMQEDRLSPTLTIAVNGTITVDWGDNTTADTVTGSSLTTRQAVPHTYTSVGEYMITIHVVSGSFQFYGSNSYILLRKSSARDSSRVYANCVKEVRIGSGTTNIGQYAFYYCTSLASITIPRTVTGIETYAFNQCFSLTSIVIPSDVTSIGDNAVSYCYSLSNITMPSGITSIGGYTFYSCYCLSDITIPSGVASIGNRAFYNCYALQNITLPTQITSINEYEFYHCDTLASITIPSGVTNIGANAFQYAYALATLTIPNGVTNIGNSAFAGCYGMAEYHIKPTTPPTLGTSAFASIESDCKIYVPSASLSTYQTASNWSDYASYMVGE